MTDDAPLGAVEIAGTAQGPRTLPWAPNLDGPREPEQAVALARRRGVLIPDDIRFVFRDDLGNKDAYAEYGGFQSSRLVQWSDFYGKGETIPVKVRRSILDSDEAIVAVLGHEMFELNALREMFEERQSIPGIEIVCLIKMAVHGNLHDRAWDEADRLVRLMRQEGT